ncbi:YeeE/YedE family protein [Salinispirillum marinum]|uniref:YeeE/YedE family protein n=2 Tax=Saccharospirillaceae TaxID=255527 RepID=A0ABV8BD53_9GAMM
MSNTELAILGGGIIGLLFGMVGQRSGFCLMRGLEHAWVQNDGRKLRAFATAMAVALLLTQVLNAVTDLDLTGALYLQPTMSWLLVPVGGVMFGLGMVLANGCGARALVLLGQGNLRSLVVLLVLGLTAYMTLSGVLAPLRLWLEGLTTIRLPARSLPLWFSQVGVSVSIATAVMTLLLAGGLVLWAFQSRTFRQAKTELASGVIIGVLVAAGWWVTGVLAADIFTPVRLASLTFVAPIGDSVQYLMISTGMNANFGISVVGGMIAGSLFMALITGTFQWESYSSPQHMRRSVSGAVLMGCGGVLALGCSIGQGLTGFSTLALTSFVAIGAIVFGAWLGLKGPLRSYVRS